MAGAAEAEAGIATHHQIAALHRARKRHIDQAQVLGLALTAQAGLDLIPARRTRAVVEHQLAVLVVPGAHRAFAAAAHMTIKQKGAEHDAVFQALGTVHGDDLHQIAVGLQPELGGFAAAALAPPRRQRAQQELGRGRAGGLLQQLSQVHQIGQTALAIGARQQAHSDALVAHPLAQHDAKAPRQPQLAPAHKGIQGGEQGDLVIYQTRERGGITAHRHGGERSLDSTLAQRLGDRQQHALQLLGVVGLEHAGLRQLDAAHPKRRQRAAHACALAMAAHQHGNVGRTQRRVTHAHRARAAATKQAGDLGRAGMGGTMQRVCARKTAAAWAGSPVGNPGGSPLHALIGSLVAHRLRVIARNAPQLQRRQIGAICAVVDEGRAQAAAFVDAHIVQPIHHEHRRVGAEQGIAGVDQRRRRALVVAQGVARVGTIARAEIGEQVGTAKAVDRLFRITDQEQAAVTTLGAVDAIEDAELQRIGVLKLIDERDRIARMERSGEPGLGA